MLTAVSCVYAHGDLVVDSSNRLQRPSCRAIGLRHLWRAAAGDLAGIDPIVPAIGQCGYRAVVELKERGIGAFRWAIRIQYPCVGAHRSGNAPGQKSGGVYLVWHLVV